MVNTFPALYKSDGSLLCLQERPFVYYPEPDEPTVRPSTLLFVCCLFSWRYNPLWLYFHNPVAGFSLLVFEVS
jgi:hypothetical protein